MLLFFFMNFLYYGVLSEKKSEKDKKVTCYL